MVPLKLEYDLACLVICPDRVVEALGGPLPVHKFDEPKLIYPSQALKLGGVQNRLRERCYRTVQVDCIAVENVALCSTISVACGYHVTSRSITS